MPGARRSCWSAARRSSTPARRRTSRELIREGWIQTLFAGNALATHDIEQALFGTSLGVSLIHGEAIEHGHEHHLRAINTIRRLGGIRQAVASGVLRSGIMYECVKADVDLVLAGSIRDDGPLPEVITDTLAAQKRMRQAIRDVGFALLIATALHSIATGNLLPAWVKVVCVDINPATVTKLSDRGTFQTIGLVTDVEPFLRSLALELHEIARERFNSSLSVSTRRTVGDRSSPGRRCPVGDGSHGSDAPDPDVPARVLSGSSTRSTPG